ncbi:hypothetical protein [Vampirovibrio sp.]|uniref:hypothetical protein n=1 Tax=Vampirovibrio sp. TaxID=2717857 RepID=UPI0035946BAA
MVPFIRIALSLAMVTTLCVSPASARARQYASATDLQISSQEIESASVGRDLMVHAVQVAGKLAAGRNITGTECTVLGNVSAGHNVLLESCPQVQSVSSGHDAAITRSQILNHVAAGHDITLHGATIEQRVSAGNQVVAETSIIKGLLSLGGHYAKLDDTTAVDIVFSEANNVSNGSGIHIGGNNFSSVRVGSSSLSSINGFTVKGAMNQTTVITPEQSIYVNGLKVSGDGPKTYGEYQGKHPEAPTVHGPGWSNEAPKAAPQTSGKPNKASQAVINTLELSSGSLVSGQVNFESGYGKVIVHPGSQFQGKVINGFVEKSSR